MELFGPNTIVDGAPEPGFVVTRRPNTKAEGAAYEKAVLALRARIAGAPFGRRMLELLCNNIAPTLNKMNAAVVSVYAADGAAVGEVTTSKIPGVSSEEVTVAGTGRGSVAVLLFHPNGTFDGLRADVLLLHELVHAYRKAQGRWAKLPIQQFLDPGQSDLHFPNWEEWFAVAVESTYAAEAGVPKVRIGHDAFSTWSLFMADQNGTMNFTGRTFSQNFADRYWRAIERILQQEPEIYRAMAASAAWFNPVRDFERDMLSSRT